MRISYEVSKAAFVSILLFLAGIFCIVKGGGVIYRGHHAPALSELYGTALREGSYTAVAARFFEGKLAGIFLVLFSIKKIWKWFMHSGLTMAVKINRTFEKRTLHDDIEDCELRIAVLEDLLRKANFSD